MKKQGKYILGTAEEVASYILKYSFDKNNYLNECASFIECDFAVANESCINSEDLEEIEFNSDGWYGIKKVDTGFESNCLDLVSDYYGGGCGHFCSIMPEETKKVAVSDVKDTILYTLNCIGSCYENDLLIVCLKTQGYYFTFGSDSKFPYQGGHVVVVAETLEDAMQKFRTKFPDKTPGCLNCAFYYTEKEWNETSMCRNGSRCHMVID